MAFRLTRLFLGLFFTRIISSADWIACYPMRSPYLPLNRDASVGFCRVIFFTLEVEGRHRGVEQAARRLEKITH